MAMSVVRRSVGPSAGACTRRSLLALAAGSLALLGCRPGGKPRPPAPSPQVIRHAIEARIAAWARWTAAGQLDSLADLFTADAWEADPNHPPIRGRAAVLDHWRGAVAVGRWQFVPEVEEVIVRDSTAVERSRYTLRFTAAPGAAGPPSFDDEGSWVNVWRLEADGRWRLQWTIAASARPSAPGK